MFGYNIGIVSLNLSALFYFVWFIPQLILTFKHRQISSLSVWMHSLLFLGYLADVVYGFGQQFPLQYRLVSVAGLMMLTISHYQFWRYNAWQAKERKNFYYLTLFFAVLLLIVLYQVVAIRHSAQFYNTMGLLSWVCWLSFLWPQLLKNRSHQSTKGLSLQTAFLSLFLSLCDFISAFALAWPWPSKLGTLLGLLPKLFLLIQCYYYRQPAVSADREQKLRVYANAISS